MDRIYNENREPKVIEYLTELIKIGQKYQLSLAHEDFHGSFLVQKPNKDNEIWLMSAAQDLEE